MQRQFKFNRRCKGPISGFNEGNSELGPANILRTGRGGVVTLKIRN